MMHQKSLAIFNTNVQSPNKTNPRLYLPKSSFVSYFNTSQYFTLSSFRSLLISRAYLSSDADSKQSIATNTDFCDSLLPANIRFTGSQVEDAKPEFVLPLQKVTEQSVQTSLKAHQVTEKLVGRSKFFNKTIGKISEKTLEKVMSKEKRKKLKVIPEAESTSTKDSLCINKILKEDSKKEIETESGTYPLT